MDNIFFHEKGKKILLSLNKNKRQSITEVAREIDSAYAHTFNLLKELEGLKIVKSTKDGRTKYIELTPKGMQLAKITINFENTLNDKVKKRKSTSTKTPHDNFVEKYLLEKYKDVVDSVFSDLESKKLENKEAEKYSKILKRYELLIKRLKPKDKTGKNLKNDLLKRIGSTTGRRK